jgi:DNA-binding NarL/FixJ family response regulator
VSVILVIDEHRVYRSGIRELIEARIQRARVVEASGFEPLAESQYFDLVLIDSGCLSYRLLDLLKGSARTESNDALRSHVYFELRGLTC